MSSSVYNKHQRITDERKQKTTKQTSYSDEHGVIIMMRTKSDSFVTAFGKVWKFQEKYPVLKVMER